MEALWSRRFFGPRLAEWLKLRCVQAGLVAAAFCDLMGFRRASGRESRFRPCRGHGFSSQYEKYHEGGSFDGGSGIFWASLAGMIGVVVLGGARRRGQVILACGLGTIALAELSLYAQTLLVCAPVETFLGSPSFKGGLQRVKDEPSGPGRVASVGTLYPDLGAVAGTLEKTNINDGFQIQHSADLYERLYPILEPSSLWRSEERAMDTAAEQFEGTIAQTVMDLMNVRFLVADRSVPLRSLQKIGGNASTLWRNCSAMPRAYVVPRAIESRPIEGEAVARTLRELDPRAGVVMSRDPLTDRDRQPFTPARWLSHDPDEVTIGVETQAPGLLVVGNTWMPGWSAVVDSSPAPVLVGNHWQQVVPIQQPGRHLIVLRYQPPGLDPGLAITVLTLMGWGGFGMIRALQLARKPTWNGLAVFVAPKRLVA